VWGSVWFRNLREQNDSVSDFENRMALAFGNKNRVAPISVWLEEYERSYSMDHLASLLGPMCQWHCMQDPRASVPDSSILSNTLRHRSHVRAAWCRWCPVSSHVSPRTRPRMCTRNPRRWLLPQGDAMDVLGTTTSHGIELTEFRADVLMMDVLVAPSFSALELVA
jgi:hypothetical protein